MRDASDVAVDVAAEVELYDVAGGEGGARVCLRGEGGVVADALVDGHAHGEGHALLHGLAILLLVVDLGEGLGDDLLTDLDEVEDGAAGLALAGEGLEGEVGDASGLEVLCDDLGVGQVSDLLLLGGLLDLLLSLRVGGEGDLCVVFWFVCGEEEGGRLGAYCECVL